MSNALRHLLALKVGDPVRIINFDGLSKDEILILHNNNFFCWVNEVNCYPCTDELPGQVFIGDDFQIIPHRPLCFDELLNLNT